MFSRKAEHGAARHGTRARHGTARERHFKRILGTEQGTSRHADAARHGTQSAIVFAFWEPSTARRGTRHEWTPLLSAALALFCPAQRLKTRAPNVRPARRAHCPLALAATARAPFRSGLALFQLLFSCHIVAK